MSVIACNRTTRPDIGVPQVDIDTLLAKSDIVSLNLVLNDETRGFLRKERIARMKTGAIYVNTARGALADEAALIAALQKRAYSACGTRRLSRRAAEGRSSAGKAAQRDADIARRIPDAGSVDDTVAPCDRYREGHFLAVSGRIDLPALPVTIRKNGEET